MIVTKVRPLTNAERALIIAMFHKECPLSKGQKLVVALYMMGHTGKDITVLLDVESVGGPFKQLDRARMKYGANNTAELIKLVLEEHWLGE